MGYRSSRSLCRADAPIVDVTMSTARQQLAYVTTTGEGGDPVAPARDAARAVRAAVVSVSVMGHASAEAAWVRAHTGPLSVRRMSSALDRIAAFVEGQDKLAVTRAAERHDPYAVLVSTIISLRTRDEVTDLVTPRILAEAPTAGALAGLSAERIAEIIYPACFYRVKGRTLRAIGRALVDQHGGRVPDTLPGLLSLGGVGRKTANLVLTLGHEKPGICVDTHVHRISNRLGFVRTRAPDDTERVLRAEAAAPVLDPDQRSARDLRPRPLRAALAALLDLPGRRHLPARRGRAEPLRDRSPAMR